MRLLTLKLITTFSIVCVIAIATAATAGRVTGAPLPRNGGEDDELLQQAKSLFQVLPKDMATAEFPVTPERVRLGHMLFFDPRISTDGTGSCVRCHQPGLYGADGVPKSIALHDKVLPRNAPTVINAG